MRCDDVRIAFLSGEEGEVEQQHMAACEACQADLASLNGALRLLADPLLWEDPDPRLEAQVVGLISRSAPRAGGPPGRRRGSWRAAFVAAAAVAGALVAVAVWSLVRSPGADWKVPLPGTVEAPTAAAVVEGWNEPTGTRVVLTVDGLAPAPEGSVYEFWFSRDSLHVSAGTFTGSGEVEMWVGVTRGAFPRLWVTLEPLDEDETPSRLTVLDTAPSG